MDEETMVDEALTEEMISAGRELIKLLDQYKLSVSDSYWLYLSEINAWRLVIVSPEVLSNGPKNVYKSIQSILQKSSKHIGINLQDISVVGPNDFIATLFRTAIKTGKGISGIRFSRNTINGFYIDDAYIYRIT